jgi:hypothetical protein
MNKINVSQVLSKNCGGYGAWISNTLSSPAPGPEFWPGFQLGGGGGSRRRRRISRRHKYRKSRKNKKHYQKKTRRH